MKRSFLYTASPHWSRRSCPLLRRPEQKIDPALSRIRKCKPDTASIKTNHSQAPIRTEPGFPSKNRLRPPSRRRRKRRRRICPMDIRISPVSGGPPVGATPSRKARSARTARPPSRSGRRTARLRRPKRPPQLKKRMEGANLPPYRPELVAKVKDLADHQNKKDPAFYCAPKGFPRVGPPTEIVQTPKTLVFLYDTVNSSEQNAFRVVSTDGRPARSDAESLLLRRLHRPLGRQHHGRRRHQLRR